MTALKYLTAFGQNRYKKQASANAEKIQKQPVKSIAGGAKSVATFPSNPVIQPADTKTDMNPADAKAAVNKATAAVKAMADAVRIKTAINFIGLFFIKLTILFK
ncbi:MAG: hypothetical protein FWG44_05235 [Oscillospiraceae bacterium]|nr:hypothetical protein [Oscillospiraceae bacterium]